MGNNSYIIDYDPMGKPYLGMLIEAFPVSATVFICYPETADAALGAMNQAVNKLKATPRKLIEVKGSLNGKGGPVDASIRDA